MKKALLLLFTILGSLSVQAKIVKGYSLSGLLDSLETTAIERYWLNSMGPLNRSVGVVGSRGPLGYLGAFGENWWNVTPYFDTEGDWSELAESLSEIGGPLSELGPLFLSTEAGQQLLSFDFTPGSAYLLSAGGALMTLGPSGPLGVMGLMGPLGPHGVHGYSRNESGEYVDKQGKRVKTISVKLEGQKQQFSLVEFYRPGHGRLKNDLDSSFVAQDSLSRSEVHSYKVKLSANRWVTLTALSLFDLDAVKLQVKTLSGEVLYSSDDSLRSNFINLKTTSSTTVQIEVSVLTSLQLFEKPYRLMVIEAPKNATEIK
jgi:hypothetical protein